MLSAKDEDKFFSQVRRPRIGFNSCWIWTGKTGRSGHGEMIVNGKREAAHRISWRIHNGIIPSNQVVRHKCGIHTCVRPSHLQLGSHKDNMRDVQDHNRQISGGDDLEISLEESILDAYRKNTNVNITKLGKRLGASRATMNRRKRDLINAGKLIKHGKGYKVAE